MIKNIAVNLFAIVVMAGLATGCASANYNKSASTAANLGRSSDMIAKSSTQIDDSLAALNDLVSNPQPDLRNQYKAFASSVSALNSTAKDVAGQTEAMKTRGAAYFEEWDNENATLRNENIRSRSEERKTEVAAHFNRISLQYDATRTAFQPYLSDLQDVQKFLSNDLTTGGLAAIKDIAAKASADAVPLKESLGRLSDEFKSLGNSMSPTTAAVN